MYPSDMPQKASWSGYSSGESPVIVQLRKAICAKETTLGQIKYYLESIPQKDVPPFIVCRIDVHAKWCTGFILDSETKKSIFIPVVKEKEFNRLTETFSNGQSSFEFSIGSFHPTELIDLVKYLERFCSDNQLANLVEIAELVYPILTLPGYARVLGKKCGQTRLNYVQNLRSEDSPRLRPKSPEAQLRARLRHSRTHNVYKSAGNKAPQYTAGSPVSKRFVPKPPSTPRRPFIVYTDGSCRDKTWGTAFVFEDLTYGWDKGTQKVTVTSIHAELRAILDALYTLKREYKDLDVAICTDSQSVISLMDKTYLNKKGRSLSLTESLVQQAQEVQGSLRRDNNIYITFRWVRGHADDKVNDIVDRLARAAMREELYFTDETKNNYDNIYASIIEDLMEHAA